MRLRLILTGLFLFELLAPVLGQEQKMRISGKSLVELKREDSQLIKPSFYAMANALFLPEQLKKAPLTTHPPHLKSILKKEWTAPLVYSYDELGMFCKFEVQLERMAKFPVKLRLGDVQYVDWLEGKRAFAQ